MDQHLPIDMRVYISEFLNDDELNSGLEFSDEYIVDQLKMMGVNLLSILIEERKRAKYIERLRTERIIPILHNLTKDCVNINIIPNSMLHIMYRNNDIEGIDFGLLEEFNITADKYDICSTVSIKFPNHMNSYDVLQDLLTWRKMVM